MRTKKEELKDGQSIIGLMQTLTESVTHEENNDEIMKKLKAQIKAIRKNEDALFKLTHDEDGNAAEEVTLKLKKTKEGYTIEVLEDEYR